MKVKTFDPAKITGKDDEMEECADGYYVYRADYEALEKEVKRLQVENGFLNEEVMNLQPPI